MALYTFDYLEKTASTRAVVLQKNLVVAIHDDELMTKTAADRGKQFDVFLSHSYKEEKQFIWALKHEIEGLGLEVYIDWIDDPLLKRSDVTPATADQLRRRMNNCRSLVVVTSENTPSSKWVPWEMGCMDGRTGKVAVLPIVNLESDSFNGLEYFGIYPIIKNEFVELLRKNIPVVRLLSGSEQHLDNFVRH
jgi:hypothetical protein